MNKEEIKQQFENISELLYQQNIKGAYTRLVQVLPQFEAFLMSCDDSVQTELMGVLQSALEAMEQQDLTLLGDILQYEIIERLEEL